MRITTVALSFALAIVFTGCNGGGSSPSPTPTPQLSNISGDYIGTIQDAQLGPGGAAATLAQHGASAGGNLNATPASGPITAQLSLTITPANALSGAMVIDFANGTTCTFSTTGTYANTASTAVINGSYTAVTNCTGDTGTYVLNQQCTDTITSVDRRVMTYPPRC